LRAFWGVVTMVFITLSAYNWRLALIDSGKNPAWLGFDRYPASLIFVVIVFVGGLYLVASGLKQKYRANHTAGRMIIDDSPERMKERQKRHEFLINQYKASVTPLEMVLSGAELADYFSKVLYVEAVPLEQIPERFLAYNFENAYVNQNKIALNEGIWRVYRVLKDEKSELYYRESRVQHEGFAWFICVYTLCFIKKKPLLRAFWGVVTMVFITLSAYNWRLALIDSGKNPAWLGFERYPASLLLVVIVFVGGLYLVASGLKQRLNNN
ncbi:MAG: hypothetical protein IIV26_10285, partial [Peptococcaceae bacterium]|nr:hypothetical protein [Peptococcaceae bacterium]